MRARSLEPQIVKFNVQRTNVGSCVASMSVWLACNLCVVEYSIVDLHHNKPKHTEVQSITVLPERQLATAAQGNIRIRE